MWLSVKEKFKSTLGEGDFGGRDTEQMSRNSEAPSAPKAVMQRPPQTLAEFIKLLRETPVDVLDDTARSRIAAVMTFDDRVVADIMTPRDQMVFVHENDYLGPLMLDKLYKSGYNYFPVVNSYNHVSGVIHTDALNALEIRQIDRASHFMEKSVNYLRETDSLKTMVEEVERTNGYYFLVLDESGALAGFATVQMLLKYFIG